MVEKIILDTNLILHSITYKIDIKSELERICQFQYTIYVLDKTLSELKILKKKLGLKIAQTFQILETKENLDVDSLLVKFSKKGYIVATQDIELKKQLQKPVIVIRQKKLLQIIK